MAAIVWLVVLSAAVVSVSAGACPVLAQPANGNAVVYSDPGRAPGVTATFSCAQHFVVVGVSPLTCQNDGQWNGAAPTCGCAVLGTPVNGIAPVLSNANRAQGVTATFTCNAHYAVTGQGVLTCTNTGQWSHAAPTCDQNECFDLIAPANGAPIAYSNGQAVGSTATYGCAGGRYLHTGAQGFPGALVRTCQAGTFQWDNAPPWDPPLCAMCNAQTNAVNVHNARSHNNLPCGAAPDPMAAAAPNRARCTAHGLLCDQKHQAYHTQCDDPLQPRSCAANWVGVLNALPNGQRNPARNAIVTDYPQARVLYTTQALTDCITVLDAYVVDARLKIANGNLCVAARQNWEFDCNALNIPMAHDNALLGAQNAIANCNLRSAAAAAARLRCATERAAHPHNIPAPPLPPPEVEPMAETRRAPHARRSGNALMPLEADFE